MNPSGMGPSGMGPSGMGPPKETTGLFPGDQPRPSLPKKQEKKGNDVMSLAKEIERSRKQDTQKEKLQNRPII